MKVLPASLIAAGLLLPAIGICQPAGGDPGRGPGGEGGARRGPHGPMMDTWKSADKDGDGSISRAEFDAMPRIQKLPEEKRDELFSRLDSNGDGKLSREDLGPDGRPGDERRPFKRLWELDTDKSGSVSLEEFRAGELLRKLPPERVDEMFKRMDTNGDGLLSPEDRPEPPFRKDGKRGERGERPGPDKGGRREGPMRLKNADADGDGAVSFEEFRKLPPVRNLTEDEQEDRFEALDKNKDQKLSGDELQVGPPPGEMPPAAAP